MSDEIPIDEMTAEAIVRDGEWRLLSQEPGVTKWHMLLPDGTEVIKKVVDIGPTLDAAHDFRMAQQNQRWGEGKIVASIPTSMLFSGDLAKIKDDEKALRRWLNDPDHAKLRTFEGKL
jgi:hypothetical protein